MREKKGLLDQNKLLSNEQQSNDLSICAIIGRGNEESGCQKEDERECQLTSTTVNWSEEFLNGERGHQVIQTILNWSRKKRKRSSG